MSGIAQDVYTVEGGAGVVVENLGAVARISTAGGAVADFAWTPATAQAGAPIVPTTILSLPFVAASAGTVLATFDGTIQVTPPAGAGALDTQGPVLTFLLDGAPTTQFAFAQLDPGALGTAFDSFAFVLTLREPLAVAPGPHTVEVQWNNLTVATPSTFNIFANGGGLSVEGKG